MPVRLCVLTLLLVVAALAVRGGSGPVAACAEKKPLQEAFSGFGAWQRSAEFRMDRKIVDALDLDDYLFHSYRRERGTVSLYIGYYRTAKKVGAAHDPLVCFTGQGWKVDTRDSGSYVPAGHPDLKICYSSMLAERQGEREMIVYWFQANDKATANTAAQKLAMVWDRLSGRSEENAFVRVSAPVGGETAEEARRRIFDFIDAFYPDFRRYVTQS